MAYEKQTWQCGDTISAEKLNHMEDGIADAGGGSSTLVVNGTTDEGTGTTTLDKTWQEISDAFPNVYLATGALKTTVLSVMSGGGLYDVSVVYVNGSKISSTTYRTTAADGYPSDDGES